MIKRAPKTREHLYKHARKRAMERYHLDLTPALYEEMITLIQRNKCFSLGKESVTRSHFMIHSQYIVVYDCKRKAISTFLPPEAIWNYLPLDERGKPAKIVTFEE